MGSVSRPGSPVLYWPFRPLLPSDSLYGPHASGTDLDTNERAMLARLGRNAAALYAELESDELRGKIVKLERKLSAVRPSSRTGPRSG